MVILLKIDVNEEIIHFHHTRILSGNYRILGRLHSFKF